jgi:diguanylate cyclase (GGDEF)-like protein/PAS domain S-box-containing protein
VSLRSNHILSGTPPAKPGLTVESTDVMRAEQVRSLYASIPASFSVNLLIALILVGVQSRVLPLGSILIWLACLTLVLGARVLLYVAHRRSPVDAQRHRQWLFRFRVSTASFGVVWGLASILLFPESDVPHQAFLAFALAGLTAGAITLLSIDRIAVLLFTVIALGALIVRLFSLPDAIQLAMAAMVSVYLVFVVLVAERSHRTRQENLKLRIAEFEHEKAFKENAARLSEAQRVARVGNYDWNPITGKLQWSDEHFRLWGLQPQCVRPDYELYRQGIHPEDLASLEDKIQQALQRDGQYEFVHRVVWPNCEERWILARGEVEFNPAGQAIRMFGTVLDITEQKQAELSVIEFKNTLEQAHDCIFIFDAATLRFTYVNKGAIDQVGYSREELLAMHPYDIKPELGKFAFQKLIAPLFNEEKSSLTFETLHQHKDGSRIPVEIHLQYISGETSQPHFIAIAHDISERQQADAELRIAAIAFESMEGIVVTDANQIILKVNRAFSDITGYSATEAIGKTVGRLLKSGRHTPDFYQEMWRDLQHNKFWQGEIWNRRKNGKVYPEWLSISTLCNSEGAITHYIALFSDITEKKQAEETIYNLAFYDALTGLPNRRLLVDRLQNTIASCARHQRHGAVLFIDLDNFKVLNDTLGHDIGDQLLIEIARRLKECVRMDDTVARQGGDEFVVVLNDLNTDTEQAAVQAELIAEKIRTSLNHPYTLSGHEYHGSPSIGISLFLSQEFTVDELLKRADTAMYQAKRAGRNTIRFFDPDTHAAMQNRIALETDLRHALAQNQLRLYYQMQVDHTGTIVGAEILLRWQHPSKGLLPPLQFIPLAEETGLILPIGQWALETACRQLQVWQAQPQTRDLHLAVNVSARQFRQSDFVAQVDDMLTRTGVDPSKLKLELTESLMLDNINQTIIKMQALKGIGVCFSMDDFGTGYSSLAYLSQLPLDQVKIDQSFVRNLDSKPGNAIIVQTIIGMTKNLGLNVIAEGVETHSQRAFLEQSGCYHYQGYLFSKPVPFEEFEKLLAAGSVDIKPVAEIKPGRSKGQASNG